MSVSKSICTIVSMLVSLYLQAQDTLRTNDVSLHVNYSHVGLSANAEYSVNRPKASFYAGIKIHGNRIITDNQQFAYRHRFYSQSFAETIGLTTGLRRYFKLKHSAITPYLTVNFHASRIGLRNDYLTVDTFVTVSQLPPAPPQYDTALIPVYKYFYTDPFFTLESTIGFGLLIRAYKNLYISQSVSLGLATHFEKQEPSPYTKPVLISYDPCDLYRIGLIYRFEKRRR